MEWPAGVMARMNAAVSTYNSVYAMKNADNLNEWASRNQEMFSIATSVEKMRRAIKKEKATKEAAKAA